MEGWILFRVSSYSNTAYVFTWAQNREHAKRNAHSWLGGNVDQYTVEPLHAAGDRVHLNLTMYV